MAIEIKIDDSRIANLSDDAQETLEKQVNQYVDSLVKEASLIEEGQREDGASTEITSHHILSAVRKTKSLITQKASGFIIGVKIVSPLSLLITGFLFDSDGYYQNTGKLIIFIVFLIVACVSTVIQHIKE